MPKKKEPCRSYACKIQECLQSMYTTRLNHNLVYGTVK